MSNMGIDSGELHPDTLEWERRAATLRARLENAAGQIIKALALVLAVAAFRGGF